MPKPVLSKRDFVKRYIEGEFGNRSPTWKTFEEYKRAEYPGKVHFRNKEPAGKTFYNVTPTSAGMYWSALSREFSPDQFYISAMAPTEKTVLQGEFIELPKGPSLTYTMVKKPMRDALKDISIDVTGIVALVTLETSMNDKSYEWFNHLRNEYPEHAIEFSVYSSCWGTEPGHNTVFWEVRDY